MRYILIIIALFLCGCRKGDGICLNSVGDSVNIDLTLPPFKNINVRDNLTVDLVKSTEHKINFIGGKNILKGLKYSVTNDTLYIQEDNRCRWYRNYKDYDSKLIISYSTLEYMRLQSGCNITSSDTLTGNRFFMEAWDFGGILDLPIAVDTVSIGLHTGPGDIIIHGTANVSYFYAAGSAHIDGANLIAQKSYVHSATTGLINVRAINILNVQIYSLGNVNYQGSPAVILKDEGEGALIKVD